MAALTQAETRVLGGKTLREVSRSFFLTLKLLPPGMREICSLGYLLARTSDTIADTTKAPIAERRLLLRQFRDLVQAVPISLSDAELLHRDLNNKLAPNLTDQGEKNLIGQAETCFQWLASVTDGEYVAIKTVLGEINKGQLNDLDLFSDSSEDEPHFLANEDELITYTDQVAGSVGRFWTEVAGRANSDFTSMSKDSMMDKASAYGRGLQLVNVIRDLGEDLRNGRCYLPRTELREGGWIDGSWKPNQGTIMVVAGDWMHRAEDGIRAGVRYSESLNHRRLKLASVMPAMIGARTLRAIRGSQSSFLSKKIKVSRGEVRSLLIGTGRRVMLGQPLMPYFDRILE